MVVGCILVSICAYDELNDRLKNLQSHLSNLSWNVMVSRSGSM